MSRYFGTDGFRGEANINLTADHAYQVGRFLGWYYNEKRAHAAEEGRPVKEGPARIVIGKDTRRSSYMFEYSLVAGLVASGADAYMLHVTTTPSVAYIARVDDFDCGIMISASHNPTMTTASSSSTTRERRWTRRPSSWWRTTWTASWWPLASSGRSFPLPRRIKSAAPWTMSPAGTGTSAT